MTGSHCAKEAGQPCVAAALQGYASPVIVQAPGTVRQPTYCKGQELNNGTMTLSWLLGCHTQ